MERRQLNPKLGIPKKDLEELAQEWSKELDSFDLDTVNMEIEATQMAKQYACYHVPELGSMTNGQPPGVFRLMGWQVDSLNTQEVRERVN